MRITQQIVEKVADEIKQTFLSKARIMANAYERMPGGLPVAITCQWKPSSLQETIKVDIGISFKIDECREKQVHRFTENEFGSLFEKNGTGEKKNAAKPKLKPKAKPKTTPKKR